MLFLLMYVAQFFKKLLDKKKGYYIGIVMELFGPSYLDYIHSKVTPKVSIQLYIYALP